MKRSRNPVQLWTVLSLGLPYLTSGQWGGPYCLVDSLPIVLLEKNVTSGEYTVIERYRSDKDINITEGQFRRLEAQDLLEHTSTSLRSRMVPGLQIANDQTSRDLSLVFENNLSGNSSLDEETSAPTSSNTVLDHLDSTTQNTTEYYLAGC